MLNQIVELLIKVMSFNYYTKTDKQDVYTKAPYRNYVAEVWVETGKHINNSMSKDSNEDYCVSSYRKKG